MFRIQARMEKSENQHPWAFADGGGEMARRIRDFEWSSSALGPPSSWSASLRTALRIVLTTNHPAFLFWGDENICFYNDAYSRSLGPEKHPSILGARGEEAWQEVWPIIGPQIAQVRAGGGATWHENHLVPITRHGSLQNVYWTYSYGPIGDEDAANGIGGVLVLCSETTDQVVAEQGLRTLEQQWRNLFDHSPGLKCVLEGPEHRIGYVNHKLRELIGPRELIGRTVASALPELRKRGFVAALDSVYRSGMPFEAHGARIRFLRSRDRSQADHFVDLVLQPKLDANGAVSGVYAEGVDVTRSVSAESALRASREEFRVMADGVPAMIWVTDASGRIEFVNEAYLNFYGITREQLRERRWTPKVHPQEAYGFAAEHWEALLQPNPFRSRARVRHNSGAWRWVEFVGVPRFDRGREFLGHVGMSADVTELVSAQQEMQRAASMKDEFIATLAHELRGPLAPVRNAVRIIRAPAAVPVAREWSLSVIERQVGIMARLLDDLLDISRVAQGKLALVRQRVSILSVVDAAIEIAQPLMESKRHIFTKTLPPRAIEINVDSLRITQILANLLTNAAKYTDPGGGIDLRVNHNSANLELEVSDSGIGLTPDEIESIFRMYNQTKSGSERSQGGLGIGLALVKGLLDLHGGSIEVHSAGRNRGSRFVVTLPDCVARADSAEVVAEPNAGKSFSPRRVLVVADHGDSTQSLMLLIGSSGHDVRMAINGEEALRLAREFRPHIVFVNTGIPFLGAYAIARALRSESWGRPMTLVALMDRGHDTDKSIALAAGFDEQLTKPVDAAMLNALFSGPLQASRSH